MNLGELRNYINFVINKDQLGEPQSPESYNTLLPVVSIEKYNQEYDKWVKTKESDPLKRFIKKFESNMENGELSLPSDYKYFISLLLEDDGVSKVVNMVSDIDQRFNLLDPSPVELPIGAELPQTIEVYPATSGKTQLRYFRTPVEPYYDFCMDSEDNEIYMPINSFIYDHAFIEEDDPGPALTDSVMNLYTNIGEVLATNVTKTGGFYRSKSVELDWSVTDHLAIAEMIIAKVSRKNKELNDYQVATMEANK